MIKIQQRTGCILIALACIGMMACSSSDGTPRTNIVLAKPLAERQILAFENSTFRVEITVNNGLLQTFTVRPGDNTLTVDITGVRLNENNSINIKWTELLNGFDVEISDQSQTFFADGNTLVDAPHRIDQYDYDNDGSSNSEERADGTCVWSADEACLTSGLLDVPESQSAGQPQPLLSGPAQVIVAECGSSEVSPAGANNSIPTAMFVNQVVQGSLLEGSAVSDVDLWQVTLEPGNYHLVADVSQANGERGTVGLEINSVTPAGDTILASDSVSAEFDIRTYEYLQIDVTQTLTLKVEPLGNEIHDYQLAIYRNGTAVPSPRLTLCPAVTAISLDETRSIPDFPEVRTFEAFRWFSLDVQAGTYSMDITGSTSADAGAISYRALLFERFGEEASVSNPGDTFAEISNNGPVLSDSYELNVRENGVIWIRMDNRRETINMELTIRAL